MIKACVRLAVSVTALCFLTSTFAGPRLTCAKGDKLVGYAVPQASVVFGGSKQNSPQYWSEGCAKSTKQSGSCPAGYKKVTKGMSYRCENQNCKTSCPSGQHVQPGNCEKCVADGCSSTQVWSSMTNSCISRQNMPMAPGAGCNAMSGHACPA